MDKKMARTNLRMGITLFFVLMFMLALTFVWATIYLNTVSNNA